MIPALIVVGALALTGGVAAGSAASHRPERTVVVEQRPEVRTVEPRRHVSYAPQRTEKTVMWRAPAEGGSHFVRDWTPNMGAGTHNSFDADQG